MEQREEGDGQLGIIDEDKGASKKVFMKMDWKTIGLQFVVATVVSVACILSLAPLKSGFDELSTKVNEESTKAIASMTTKATELTTAVNKELAAQKATVDAKIAAEDAKIVATETRVNTFDAKVAALAGLDTTVTAKLATVDATIAGYAAATDVTVLDAKLTDLTTKLTALQTKVDALPVTTSTGGTTTGGTNTGIGSTIATTSGQAAMSIVVSPNTALYSSGSYTYFLSVTNTSTSAEKIYLEASAYPTTQTYSSGLPDIVTGTTKFSTSGATLTATTFTMSYTPPTGVKCYRMYGYSDGHIALGPNSTVSFPITLDLNYVAGSIGAFWDVKFNAIVTPW